RNLGYRPVPDAFPRVSRGLEWSASEFSGGNKRVYLVIRSGLRWTVWFSEDDAVERRAGSGLTEPFMNAYAPKIHNPRIVTMAKYLIVGFLSGATFILEITAPGQPGRG